MRVFDAPLHRGREAYKAPGAMHQQDMFARRILLLQLRRTLSLRQLFLERLHRASHQNSVSRGCRAYLPFLLTEGAYLPSKALGLTSSVKLWKGEITTIYTSTSSCA